MVQGVEHLSSKHKTMSSNPSTSKKQKVTGDSHSDSPSLTVTEFTIEDPVDTQGHYVEQMSNFLFFRDVWILVKQETPASPSDYTEYKITPTTTRP
jgi:hypothetical protein